MLMFIVTLICLFHIQEVIIQYILVFYPFRINCELMCLIYGPVAFLTTVSIFVL